MESLLCTDVRTERAARPAPRTGNTAGPTVWAVASGKGGVGKSVLSASLAIGLSQTGPRAVAVDLDSGSANLHTLLGCARAPHTLSDFACGRLRSLDDALAATTVPGVRLLSGARASLDAADATRAQTHRILRALAEIDALHAVLDLGAGTGSHTLDAFAGADRRILVVTPESTAIENAYHFLKAAFFRAVRELAGEGACESLSPVFEAARQRGASPLELVETASRTDARAGAQLRARLREFEVDLVVNRVDPNEPDPGPAIAEAARAELGMNLRLAGSIAEDAAVRTALQRGVPVMQLFPAARFSTDVQALVAALFAHVPASATRAIALAAAAPEPRAAEPAPLAPPALHPDAPLGPHLRERREALGLDLRALHERTRIRHHYIEAIEAERFAAMPPDLFLREYVRQLAQVLAVSDPVDFARRYVARAHATQRGAELASAVVAGAPRSLAAGPVEPRAARRVPSPEELLAGFDYEPELDAPDEDRLV